MPFYICCDDKEKNPYDDRFGPYETAAHAKALMAARDLRKPWRIKAILDDKWRMREQQRFLDGEYESLPWWHRPWWQEHAIKDHFAHVSKKQPGMIAYTASPEDGVADKQTTIKPGRYLEKYYGTILRREGYDIQRMALEFSNRYAPRTLLFAKTADDIERVYVNGPSSCMSDSPDNYEYGHPVRVYAAGDLEVAYITADNTEDGPIVGRCVVWPAKKRHARIYGDEARLKKSLEVAGFTYKPCGLAGAKLQRKVAFGNDDETYFVCPYIDATNQTGGGSMGVVDVGTHLEICNPDTAHECHRADRTDGLTTPPGSECNRCGAARRRSRLERVIVNEDGDHELWCNNCAADRAFWSERDDTYYHNDLGMWVYDAERLMTSEEFEYRSGFHCSDCDNACLYRSSISTEDSPICQRCFVQIWSRAWIENRAAEHLDPVAERQPVEATTPF